ncbi:hypothetical protein P7C73_g2386, partial [Tremellales sp. Uapishka_1]
MSRHIPSVLLRPCLSRCAVSSTSLAAPYVHLSSKSFASTSTRREETTDLPQTPAVENISLGPPVAYISESHDPWFNLSYEDWLLRHTPHNEPTLFIYRNYPCVVIGRNQNPWKETTPRALRSSSIPLVRRRSGGGTVYHDMGNTNFSIILPRLLFTRAHGAELVARAIRESMGIEQCGVNTRGDVVIRDGAKEFKMSSSFTPIGSRLMDGFVIRLRLGLQDHSKPSVPSRDYANFLVPGDVGQITKIILPAQPNLQTKGIPSHPSPVTTLNTYLPSSRTTPFNHDDLVKALTAEFQKVYATEGKRMETREVSEGRVKEAKVWEGVEELKGWAWQYGQSPEMSNTLEGVLSFGTISASLTARHALLTSMTLHYSPAHDADPVQTKQTQDFLDFLALALVGKRYETLDGAEGIGGPLQEVRWREMGDEIISWMRRAM